MLEDRVGGSCGVCGGQVWNGSTETCRASCRCASALNALGGCVRSSVKTLTEVKYFDGYTSRRVVSTKQAHLWEFDDQQPKHQPTLIETRIRLTFSTWDRSTSGKLELCHTADTSCHGCPQTINCKIFCVPWYVKNCCLCVGVLMWP